MKDLIQRARKNAILIFLFLSALSTIITGCAAQDTQTPMNQRWASIQGGHIQKTQAGEQFDFHIQIDEGLIAQGVPIKIKVSGVVTSGWLRFELRDPAKLVVWDSGIINPGDYAISTEYAVSEEETGTYTLGLVYGANTQASYDLGWHAIRLNPIILLPGVGMILVALAFVIYAVWQHLPATRLGMGALFWTVTVAAKFIFAIPVNPNIFQVLGATKEHLFSLGNLTAYLYIGALTGIFEVGLAWLILRKIRWGRATWNQALAFGVGFGVIEALALGFVGLGSALVSFFSPNLLPISILGNLANNAMLGLALAPIAERLSVIFAHIFSCVLIFYAIESGETRWGWLALLYKTLLDAVAGFAAFWGLDTLQKIWTTETIIAVFGLIGLWGTLQIAQRYSVRAADEQSST